MKFNNLEERNSFISKLEQLANQLQVEKESSNKDKNVNCKVCFDYIIEYDEVDRDESGEIKSCSGDIYKVILNQPRLVDSIKILDRTGKPYEMGFMAFDCMVDKNHTDPEVFTERIKLGYILRVLNHIDALMHEQKKR